MAVRACAAAALVASTTLAKPIKNCREPYECTFRANASGKEWSWDLSQLCREDDGYKYNDGQGYVTYFNICGNATPACSPGCEGLQFGEAHTS